MLITAPHARRMALVLTMSLVGLSACAGSAFAGEVTQAGTVLTYSATPGDAENLTVDQTTATAITFHDAALTLTESADDCVMVGADVACTVQTWTRVTVNAGDGGDTVDASGLEIPATLNGEAGADDLEGGAGNDSIDGGPGVDTVSGNTGADTLVVGGGTGSGSPDIASGNAGADTLTAASAPLGTFVTLNGGADNDTITMGAGDGSANGGAGDDTISLAAVTANVQATANGDDGNDTITGGPSASVLNGNDGNDTLNGGAGNEYLDGGIGADTVNGGDGDDTLSGGDLFTDNPGATPDTVTSDGADTINGGGGFDTVDYGSRTTAVNVNLAVAGGDGQAAENDNVALDVEAANGGVADDVLTGSASTNTLNGGPGRDTLDGGASFDLLNGGGDADTINSGADLVADLVDCGSAFTQVAGATPVGSDDDVANIDYLDIVAPSGDCETVKRAAAPSGAPQVGTPGDDIMIGTSFADLLIGGLGNDTLKGGGGNDTIYGGAGNDKLGGWTGNDLLDGGFGNDLITGDAGADTLNGGEGNDKLAGGPGVDVLSGGIGADRLDGGTGKDFLIARDGSKARDTVICTKVAAFSQRDVVVADARDYIANRAWCARVAVV